jgi:hypothetical protein
MGKNGMARERQGNGRGTAWERYGMCESALKLPFAQENTKSSAKER